MRYFDREVYESVKTVMVSKSLSNILKPYAGLKIQEGHVFIRSMSRLLVTFSLVFLFFKYLISDRIVDRPLQQAATYRE